MIRKCHFQIKTPSHAQYTSVLMYAIAPTYVNTSGKLHMYIGDYKEMDHYVTYHTTQPPECVFTHTPSVIPDCLTWYCTVRYDTV